MILVDGTACTYGCCSDLYTLDVDTQTSHHFNKKKKSQKFIDKFNGKLNPLTLTLVFADYN